MKYTLKTRYNIWRHIYGCDVLCAAFLAFVGWIRFGE